jgi:hypothetical protein
MTQAEAVETKVQAKRERRSWAVVMEDGAGGRLEARLERRRDGWRTLARHVTGTGKARKVARGVTEQPRGRGIGQGSPGQGGRRRREERVEAAGVAGWRLRGQARRVHPGRGSRGPTYVLRSHPPRASPP